MVGGGGGGRSETIDCDVPLPLSKGQRGEKASCRRCAHQADGDYSLCPKHPFLICVTMPARMAPDLQKVPEAKPI